MEPHSRSEQLSLSEAEEPGPSRPHTRTSPQIVEAVTRTDEEATRQHPSIFQLIGSLFRGAAPEAQQPHHRQQAASLKDAVDALLAEHDLEGGEIYILPEEQNMLRNILRMGEMSVSDIMIPRTDIAAVPYDVSLEELKQLFVSEQHSRIPVYKGSLDQVTGFVHIKDLAVTVFSGQPFSMEEGVRQLIFVPASMKVSDLLLKMRVSGVHIAIVVDEYGGTDGMVTMEDIVEQIVGEIQDEHDDEEEPESYVWLDDRTIEADGRMDIEELDTCFNGNFVLREDEEEFDTVGGLVFSHLGHVPEAGEQFDYPTGLRITVLEADPRAVKRVRIERLTEVPQDVHLAAAGK